MARYIVLKEDLRTYHPLKETAGYRFDQDLLVPAGPYRNRLNAQHFGSRGVFTTWVARIPGSDAVTAEGTGSAGAAAGAADVYRDSDKLSYLSKMDRDDEYRGHPIRTRWVTRRRRIWTADANWQPGISASGVTALSIITENDSCVVTCPQIGLLQQGMRFNTGTGIPALGIVTEVRRVLADEEFAASYDLTTHGTEVEQAVLSVAASASGAGVLNVQSPIGTIVHEAWIDDIAWEGEGVPVRY